MWQDGNCREIAGQATSSVIIKEGRGNCGVKKQRLFDITEKVGTLKHQDFSAGACGSPSKVSFRVVPDLPGKSPFTLHPDVSRLTWNGSAHSTHRLQLEI